jgi:predicted nucleic acid-binding protein
MTTHEKSGDERTRPPRVYLDTNLVSGIRKQDLGPEQQALRRLLLAYKRGTVSLVTSHVTLEEIEKLPEGEVREGQQEIYALLNDVPPIREEFLFLPVVTSRPGPKGPLPMKEADLGKLEAIVPDQNDARHLFQAIRNGVEFFVTYDKKTILRHRSEIERAFAIRACLPSELVEELGL